jgi:hypothetical protein
MEISSPSALLDGYYGALEAGTPLNDYYVTDEEAGELGPVVKIGSGKGEVFVGHESVAAAVNKVTRTLTENRLESRGPRIVRERDDLAWLVDVVWWSGITDGTAFGSPTRWTALCLRTPARDWRFLQLHVSEEVE